MVPFPGTFVGPGNYPHLQAWKAAFKILHIWKMCEQAFDPFYTKVLQKKNLSKLSPRWSCWQLHTKALPKKTCQTKIILLAPVVHICLSREASGLLLLSIQSKAAADFQSPAQHSFISHSMLFLQLFTSWNAFTDPPRTPQIWINCTKKEFTLFRGG